MHIFGDNGQPATARIWRNPFGAETGQERRNPVPQSSTLIIAQKLGDEWYVLARHPSGQQEHVRRFKSETEAKKWIATKSKAWLQKRGYTD